MPNNRKPVHLEYVGGKAPRQLIWEKIRLQKHFTLKELVGSLPGTIHRDSTRAYVKALLAAQYLGRLDDTYHLWNDNGVEAPRVRKDGTPVTQGRPQENIWRTLRTVNHPVNTRELAALASTQDHPVSVVAAKDYLRNLYQAGYMMLVGDKFRLSPAMNSGPRAPMIQRIKQVYDPNLGKVIWTDTGGSDE